MILNNMALQMQKLTLLTKFLNIMVSKFKKNIVLLYVVCMLSSCVCGFLPCIPARHENTITLTNATSQKIRFEYSYFGAGPYHSPIKVTRTKEIYPNQSVTDGISTANRFDNIAFGVLDNYISDTVKIFDSDSVLLKEWIGPFFEDNEILNRSFFNFKSWRVDSIPQKSGNDNVMQYHFYFTIEQYDIE